LHVVVSVYGVNLYIGRYIGRDAEKSNWDFRAGKESVPMAHPLGRQIVIHCPVTRQEDYSQLTPELKEFIDRLVVPILVKKYMEAAEGAEGLADPAKFAAHSVCDTGYPAPGKAMP
jgi:hypothetical protein